MCFIMKHSNLHHQVCNLVFNLSARAVGYRTNGIQKYLHFHLHVFTNFYVEVLSFQIQKVMKRIVKRFVFDMERDVENRDGKSFDFN